jgi:hypothetical protein
LLFLAKVLASDGTFESKDLITFTPCETLGLCNDDFLSEFNFPVSTKPKLLNIASGNQEQKEPGKDTNLLHFNYIASPFIAGHLGDKVVNCLIIRALHVRWLFCAGIELVLQHDAHSVIFLTDTTPSVTLSCLIFTASIKTTNLVVNDL